MSSFIDNYQAKMPLEHLRGFYTNEKGEKVEIMFEHATLEVVTETYDLYPNDIFLSNTAATTKYTIVLKPNDQGHIFLCAPLERIMEE